MTSHIKPFSIQTRRKTLQGLVHLNASYQNTGGENRPGIIMIAGAGGGVMGPGHMYDSLARDIVAQYPSAVVFRTDYRYPNKLEPCVEDCQLSLKKMQEEYNVDRCGVLGWSFGSAPALNFAVRDAKYVRAVAVVAPQTYAASDAAAKCPSYGIRCLFLHGTGDSCLPHRCSEQLARLSQGKSGEKLSKVVLFNGDNHGLTHNNQAASEQVFQWMSQHVIQSVERAEAH